jgi:hypothetical protein
MTCAEAVSQTGTQGLLRTGKSWTKDAVRKIGRGPLDASSPVQRMSSVASG